MLIALITHNRPHCLADWLRAWRYSDRTDAVLYVVSTAGEAARPAEPLPPDTKFLTMPNDGLDIGAIQRLIQSPPEPYHLLMWCPDDFLPMRGDIVPLYRRQFVENDAVGLVGTFWGVTHVRSGGVCVRREVAERLTFPPDLLHGGTWDQQRARCLAFEHGSHNFVNQVQHTGFVPRLVDGTTPPHCPDWRSMERQFVLWDRGMHSQQMWDLFDLTFPEVSADAVADWHGVSRV